MHRPLAFDWSTVDTKFEETEEHLSQEHALCTTVMTEYKDLERAQHAVAQKATQLLNRNHITELREPFRLHLLAQTQQAEQQRSVWQKARRHHIHARLALMRWRLVAALHLARSAMRRYGRQK